MGTKSVKSEMEVEDCLKRGQFHAEKCELKEAGAMLSQGLELAKQKHDLKGTMEAIAGLLRLAGEALDEASIQKWDSELDNLMMAYPKEIPPMAWYCKGAVARHRGEFMLAQRCLHRFLRAVRKEGCSEEQIVRGWVVLAVILQQRGRVRRSLWLAQEILRRYENQNYHGLNGITYLLIGTLHERQRDFVSAMRWFQKCHVSFLGEHNWYYHLYALYGYARIARHQKNFSEAYWYLDLMEKAAPGREFGLLRREILAERKRLEENAVDLLIDSRKGIVQTRENGQIFLKKQYTLLHILEALLDAHGRSSGGSGRGLSKAEIIKHVWNEPYKPDVHDNKLYYNINRLRKLIEPNVRKPQYLLNWKEGYRFAPGLRIQYVGDRLRSSEREKNGT